MNTILLPTELKLDCRFHFFYEFLRILLQDKIKSKWCEIFINKNDYNYFYDEAMQAFFNDIRAIQI